MSEHICQKFFVWYTLNWFMYILTYKILCSFTKSKKHTFLFAEETRIFYFRHWMPSPLPLKFRLQGGSGFSFGWISELSIITSCKASMEKAELLPQAVIFLPGISHCNGTSILAEKCTLKKINSKPQI